MPVESRFLSYRDTNGAVMTDQQAGEANTKTTTQDVDLTDLSGREDWTIVATLAFYVILAGAFFWGCQEPQADVLASVDENRADSTWHLSVDVIGEDGTPLNVNRVWAVDNFGNMYPSRPIDADGSRYEVDVPVRLGSKTVTQVSVHAIPAADQDHDRGSTVIQLTQSLARYKTSDPVFLLLPAILFGLTLLAAALPFQGAKIIYIFCLGGAVALSIVMVICISVGIGYVSQHGDSFEVLKMDFGYVFKGSYVPDHNKDWLFSFTRPSDEAAASQTGLALATQSNPPASTAAADEPIRGFGAPLWVILLSVIGASMFTLRIILDVIKEKIRSENALTQNVFRKNIHAIVVHQFYVLFAPIASILVYQLLVEAEAADQHVTVAIAVLGAGLATNALLDRAQKQAFKKAESAAEEEHQPAGQTVQTRTETGREALAETEPQDGQAAPAAEQAAGAEPQAPTTADDDADAGIDDAAATDEALPDEFDSEEFIADEPESIADLDEDLTARDSIPPDRSADRKGHPKPEKPSSD